MKATEMRITEAKLDQAFTDRRGLMAYLGVGRSTAERIAEAAEASVRFGGRHLYNLNKVKKFMDGISTK